MGGIVHVYFCLKSDRPHAKSIWRDAAANRRPLCSLLNPSQYASTRTVGTPVKNIVLDRSTLGDFVHLHLLYSFSSDLSPRREKRGFQRGWDEFVLR